MVTTWNTEPHGPNVDRRLSRGCDRSLASFALTDRQTRFLVTVMRHAGVFVGRQYAAFAGITHGQKVHDFIRTLVARRFATLIELGTTGRTRIIHVHYKPLYAAIGEPDNRNRRRVTIDRTIHRLMILDAVLADRSVNWLRSEREKRCYFEERLRDYLRDDKYPRLVFGKPPDLTIRYFPDKLPIGYEPDRRRHVFLYLARTQSPMDFPGDVVDTLAEGRVGIVLSTARRAGTGHVRRRILSLARQSESVSRCSFRCASTVLDR